MDSTENPTSSLERVDRILNDAVMGALALASLFLGVAPGVFSISPGSQALLDGVELAIVGLFAIEYLAALMVASSRRAFVLNPWRILDALIIGLAVGSLFPLVSPAFRSAPALRLLRLGRFALFGVRAGTALAVRDERRASPKGAPAGQQRAHALVGAEALALEEVEWEAALARIRTDNEDWLFLSGIDAARVDAVASSQGLPAALLRTRLFEAMLPRIERMERYTALFVWYPLVAAVGDGGVPSLRRAPVLLVGSAANVVVLTDDPADLLASTTGRLQDLDPSHPPLARATWALLQSVLRQYARVIEKLEAAHVALEAGQAQLGDRAFLAQTFHLRAEIVRVRNSLKHLKKVLGVVAGEALAIQGIGEGERPLFGLLADDANELYEAVDDLLASVVAVVDLRLNVASFQMNKVMRLLAILTTLTLIPTVTGGLLGMNLIGSPWSASLAQVAFGVAAGMAVSLYVFAVKGWLR